MRSHRFLFQRAAPPSWQTPGMGRQPSGRPSESEGISTRTTMSNSVFLEARIRTFARARLWGDAVYGRIECSYAEGAMVKPTRRQDGHKCGVRYHLVLASAE